MFAFIFPCILHCEPKKISTTFSGQVSDLTQMSKCLKWPKNQESKGLYPWGATWTKTTHASAQPGLCQEYLYFCICIFICIGICICNCRCICILICIYILQRIRGYQFPLRKAESLTRVERYPGFIRPCPVIQWIHCWFSLFLNVFLLFYFLTWPRVKWFKLICPLNALLISSFFNF